MKHIFSLLLFTSLAFSGISQPLINGQIQHDGLARTYKLYVPASYDGNTDVPLVFNWHGYGSNAAQQASFGDFRPIADREGFIIVHPQGTYDGIGSAYFNVGFNPLDTIDDIGFAEALLDSLIKEYSIDSSRVYSVGMSNGGYMSYSLACQMSDRIAAVASVTGSMTNIQFDSCNPQHPMPILQIHGTADSTVWYGGEVNSKSMDNIIEYWRSFNNCPNSVEQYNFPDINKKDDNTTVEHYYYNDGDNGVSAELMKVINGSHAWPGTWIAFTGTNFDIDASEEVWRFFNRYDIHGLAGFKTSLSTSRYKSEGFTIYPNPTADKIQVTLQNKTNTAYSMHSVLGDEVKAGMISSSSNTISMANLPTGIYYLQVNGQVQKLIKTD